MKKLTINSNDIIVDNGRGVFVRTQDNKRISRKYFVKLVKSKKIFYDRTQGGVDHYLACNEDGSKKPGYFGCELSDEE